VENSSLNKNLFGNRLLVIRVIWILLFILVTTVFILGVVGLHLWHSEPCSLKIAQDQLDCYATQAALQRLGLSLRFYAFYFPIGVTIQILPWILVSLLIFRFKSDEPFALSFSFALLWFGAISQSSVWSWAFYYFLPSLSGAFGRLNSLTDVLLVLVFIFPDGKFVPRWTRWFAMAWIGWSLVEFLAHGVIKLNVWTYSLANVIYSIVIVYSIIYRYRNYASPIQRQQIKWIVVAGVMYSLFELIESLFKPITLSSYDLVIFRFTFTPLSYLVSSLAAISIGISILKYRLWEIDVIVRQTLVYSSLTALLLAIYLGSVVLVQSLIFTLTKQYKSEIGIVVATLAVAALFTPFRRKIQNAIDRRFYRWKYDAAKVLAAFSVSLREEVNLDQLNERLIGVVEQTMRPEHVSLWLRSPRTNT
jgi:hypothetical protein